MKKNGLIFVIICTLMYGGDTLAQNRPVNASNTEKQLIDLPSWFADDEPEIIRKIEQQDSISWHDYIQLSVSYAQIEAKNTKIKSLVSQALKANSAESCKTLTFILQHQRDWKLAKDHRDSVNKLLQKYSCNN